MLSIVQHEVFNRVEDYNRTSSYNTCTEKNIKAKKSSKVLPPEKGQQAIIGGQKLQQTPT